MIILITLQLLAHLVSDFYLQTSKSCQNKAENAFRSRSLYIHVLITFICSWLFSFMFGFWWASLLIAILHGVVDGLKSLFGRIPWVFFIDQLLHVVIIISVSVLYNSTLWAECLSPSLDTVVVFMPEWIELPVVLWITAFVFCLKPANFFVREVFSNAHISIPTSKKSSDDESKSIEKVGYAEELLNAGRVIGNMERILTLIFMLLGHFEAIGFLLAAKSLLRFREDDSVKSEYVLVGTLLSFGIAIATGACVLLILKCFIQVQI